MGPTITIRGAKEISLSGGDFENFLYIEDINSGFPRIEFEVRDNVFSLLKNALYGDEELTIEEFKNYNFSLTNKKFTIKLIGSLGESPKPASAQTVKFVAIDSTYDKLLKNEKSIFFLPTEKKKISDLIWKLLDTTGITINRVAQVPEFYINIVDTSLLVDGEGENIFFPYGQDTVKMMRKLCTYAATPSNVGGYIFFINKKGINFCPINTLFKSVSADTPYLQIADVNCGIKNLKLSTFNAFSNFLIGHNKKIFGFNLLEKDYNIINYKPNAKYVEWSNYEEKQESSAEIVTMPVSTGIASSLPFSKNYLSGNTKTYFTTAYSPIPLKAFGDGLFYSQMFNYNLEVDKLLGDSMDNFTIGEMVNVDFRNTDMSAWESINGGWLLKSFSYLYPGDHCTLKLTRIGIGNLPETEFIRINE